jgi:hypothetical protein
MLPAGTGGSYHNALLPAFAKGKTSDEGRREQPTPAGWLCGFVTKPKQCL